MEMSFCKKVSYLQPFTDLIIIAVDNWKLLSILQKKLFFIY